MDYFKYPNYERTNTRLLLAYGENMIAYLQRQYPDVRLDELQQFVQEEVNRTLVRPTLTLIDYPSYGNANLTNVDLLAHTEHLRRHIITPAGVVYQQPSVKESFLKKKIKFNLAARKKQKKIMLDAASIGDTVIEQRAHYLQASIKIETNSIPGAFGSAFNCLFDIPGYNAVTGTGRHAVMCGYAHVEKMLEGNLYLPDLDHCINYCIQLLRHLPPNVMDVIAQYGLYIPTHDEVVEHFLISLRLYCLVTPELYTGLCALIASFMEAERSFIYYACCLKRLCVKNDAFFRTFLSEFFRTAIVVDPDCQAKDIFRLHPDLLAMLSATNASLIDYKPVADAVLERPEGVRRLYAIGCHMQSCLDRLGPLFATFLRVDCDTADVMAHPNMIRKAVIISDTDSVIFSTQSWVEWYSGGISFEKSAYEINGFVVLLTSLTLEHVFARLSTNFGIEIADLGAITMKNEFLYPLMLRTPLPKQYAGRIAIQEGFVLPKPKNDIKGLSFRSSAFCPETAQAGIDFITWIFDTVMSTGSLTATACFEHVLAHEKRIISSLQAGEQTFLTMVPVRLEHEYKDPAVSVFYYLRLWNEVFRPRFGEFIIPSKGYEIPLLADGKILKDPRYLELLLDYDKELHARLVGFMAENIRAITRLILPMTLKRVPDIFLPIIDVRGIVYSNSTPFIVTLRSLGLAYTNTKDQIMLSDIYA